MTVSTQVEELESAVDRARAEVETQRGRLAEWESKVAAAELELASLHDRAGAELLEDPDAEERIAETIGKLEARKTLARKAVEAQRPHVVLAESAYLAAEADRLEVPLAESQKRLDAHEAKTKRLLAELEEHEGPYVSQKVYVESLMSDSSVITTGLSYKIPKSERLRNEAAAARLQVQVLREMAAGRDPRPLIRQSRYSATEAYPECVQGPDALVHTHEYLDAVEALRQRVEELEELPVELRRRLAEHESVAALHAPDSDEETAVSARLRHRLASVDGELAEARRHLAALTGRQAVG